ncbi:hypothetical protein NXS19_007513 [Fusarium pseudograminearum]|nr:hypothetical protein NXS19_007513 [Fusarium pseudograminearum]
MRFCPCPSTNVRVTLSTEPRRLSPFLCGTVVRTSAMLFLLAIMITMCACRHVGGTKVSRALVWSNMVLVFLVFFSVHALYYLKVTVSRRDITDYFLTWTTMMVSWCLLLLNVAYWSNSFCRCRRRPESVGDELEYCITTVDWGGWWILVACCALSMFHLSCEWSYRYLTARGGYLSQF